MAVKTQREACTGPASGEQEQELDQEAVLKALVTCPECARLLTEYERLKGHHALVMRRLHLDATRSLPAGEYQQLLATANTAWLDMDSAAEKLEQHKRTHGDTVWQ